MKKRHYRVDVCQVLCSTYGFVDVEAESEDLAREMVLEHTTDADIRWVYTDDGGNRRIICVRERKDD